MLHFIFARQRQVLSALSQIAKHSVDLAEMVVEAEIFPVVLTCLKDKDEYVKKNTCTLIREIAKHTPEVKTNNQTTENHASRCNILSSSECQYSWPLPTRWLQYPSPRWGQSKSSLSIAKRSAGCDIPSS